MWGDQCQSCGGHENEIRSVAKCQFCTTKICNGCKLNHEPVCEVNSKRRARGEGATVAGLPASTHRPGHETPADIPARTPEIVPASTEPTKVTSQVQDEADPTAEVIESVNAQLVEAENDISDAAAEEAAAQFKELTAETEKEASATQASPEELKGE